MSETLSSSSRRRNWNKSTCRDCNRTVIVHDIEGRKVTVDPELINTVPFESTPKLILARRVHADQCVRYQSEAARIKAQAEARRAQKAEAKLAAKRAPSGKREPGQ